MRWVSNRVHDMDVSFPEFSRFPMLLPLYLHLQKQGASMMTHVCGTAALGCLAGMGWVDRRGRRSYTL